MTLSDRSNQQTGFTLIEILLSVTILSLILGLSAMGASSISKRLLIGPSDAYLENILTSASRRAREGVEGSDWGVYLPYDEESRSLNEVVVFKGESYVLRDDAFDQTFLYSSQTEFIVVNLSGSEPSTGNDHEVIFQQSSGLTDMYGSIDLDVFGVTRSVSISPQGFVTREL